MFTPLLQMTAPTGDSVWLTVLALGLLTTLNPCQLAINVSAVTWLLQHARPSAAAGQAPARRRVVAEIAAFVTGRVVTYIWLSWGLMTLIRLTGRVQFLEEWLHGRGTVWLERILPFLMLLVGLFFLLRAVHPHHPHDSCHNSTSVIRRRGHLGALFLGMILALAFCPESAFFFFGMMIPVSMASPHTWAAPVIYALAAALPILAAACCCVWARQYLERFRNRMETFQRIVDALMAIVFVGFAVWIFMAG